MRHATRSSELINRARSILDDLDLMIFFEPDLDALARGWQVHRDSRFERLYHDPRWITKPRDGVTPDGQR